MIKRLGRTILVLGMVLTTFSWLVPSASADGATVPVCPADEMAVRAALIAARYGGTVLFTCDAHITLADKLLLGDVTIDGNGFDVTIDGNNAVGVFSVFGTVSLIGLHIVNGFGSTAGAIYADKNSTLRIANSTLSGNHVLSHGGAIFASGGSITIVDSTISDNVAKEITPTGGQYGYGGAIFGSGTLVIDRSTINNNVSMNGGAILGSFSRLSISNSTLSGNSADIGGAIKIGLSSSVLEITNSTLAGNSARYGSTIMFDAAATLNATNSIFAGGGPSTTCVFPYAPTVNDLGGNLANDSSCGIGTFASLANLKLGPLADNGGPTQTIALGNGSVAIGAGDSDVCNADPINGVDQRGSARLTMTCDSGAFDTGTPPDTTAPTITPTISGTLGESGWYTSDVDVSWSVVDAESTVSSQPAAKRRR
ncbi:MAG: right-handed parallel beta-helix repeat-containing protein [Thermomicrobiales bacterium]|nr:right-handed parallel beta-helix repeat-containing protein [Thermomicrobiales bacterium]